MVRKFSPAIADRASREALCYNMIIHIHSVEDFAAAADPHLPFTPSSDDSGLGGLPYPGFNKSSPHRHFFATTFGMVDGAAPSHWSQRRQWSQKSLLPQRLAPSFNVRGSATVRGSLPCRDLAGLQGAVCQDCQGCSVATVPFTGSPRTKALDGSAASQDLNPSAQPFRLGNKTKLA